MCNTYDKHRYYIQYIHVKKSESCFLCVIAYVFISYIYTTNINLIQLYTLLISLHSMSLVLYVHTLYIHCGKTNNKLTIPKITISGYYVYYPQRVALWYWVSNIIPVINYSSIIVAY